MRRSRGLWWRAGAHIAGADAGRGGILAPPGVWQQGLHATAPQSSGKGGGRSGPFVSEHYDGIPAGAVVDFLERHGISDWKRVGQGWLNLRVCPDAVCEGASSQQASKADTGNHYTFGVHEKSGGFQCFRCSAKGNWYSFKQRMSGNSSRSPIVSVTEVAHGRAPRPPVLSAEVDAEGARASASMFAGSARGMAGGDESKEDTAITLGQTFLQYAEALPGCSPAIDFLTGTRLIRKDVLKKFKVGVALYTFKGRQLTCVTFPWFNKEDELPTRVKVRAIEDKRYMRLDPSGGPWGFFGWPTVEDSSEEVVLTEGELDALSVYQETGLPSVSLPNGARSFPPDLLEQLEQFKTIYIWCDDDVPGREGADMCVKKLGRHRCRVVKSRGGRSDGPKDANEVLVALSQLRIAHHQELAAVEARGGAQDEEELASMKLRHAEAEAELDMRKMLQAAAEVQHEHVISFRDLRDEVKQQFQDDLGNKGTSFGTSLPSLDRILKGHRSGELTILTGRTGQGKTTVCSQISLDLCEQGVHTLWGSFEVKNVRLAAKMLQQHSRASLKHCTDVVFDEAADAFTNLPLWFLGYYGSTDINDVLDAMEYAVYVHDVRHVIIDNLQFMTSKDARDGDIFRVLDTAIHKLRQFASTFNVHITLVIHPRKDDESQLLTLASVFGSAKATQESDNVIILQNNGIVKYLDVRKNRYDGELGFVPFDFNKKTMRFKELSREEVEDLTEESLDSSPW